MNNLKTVIVALLCLIAFILLVFLGGAVYLKLEQIETLLATPQGLTLEPSETIECEDPEAQGFRVHFTPNDRKLIEVLQKAYERIYGESAEVSGLQRVTLATYETCIVSPSKNKSPQ